MSKKECQTIWQEGTDMPLAYLAIGDKAQVTALDYQGAERRRMLDLGLVCGTMVEALQKSPAGDPIAYFIRGAVIALRDEDAKRILVRRFA